MKLNNSSFDKQKNKKIVTKFKNSYLFALLLLGQLQGQQKSPKRNFMIKLKWEKCKIIKRHICKKYDLFR